MVKKAILIFFVSLTVSLKYNGGLMSFDERYHKKKFDIKYEKYTMNVPVQLTPPLWQQCRRAI